MKDDLIINGDASILGRLVTRVTEEAKKGRTVHVVNCNDVVVTGDRENIIEKYRGRRERGAPYTGPHYPKSPKGIVKRAMRGMLPHEKHRGIQALKRIKCHNTSPYEVDEDEAKSIEDAQLSRTTATYITVKEISESL